MKNSKVCLFYIILFTFSCSSTSKNIQPIPKKADPEWIIHVPHPWKLYKKGKQQNLISYRLYKRKAIIVDKKTKITPVCIITNEYINSTKSLKAIALGKQTTIITSMAHRGYTLKGRRDDILNDINSFITIKDSLGLAYAFTYDGNKKDYVAISVYAAHNGHLLHVNFETTIDIYPLIRSEIKTIIESIQ